MSKCEKAWKWGTRGIREGNGGVNNDERISNEECIDEKNEPLSCGCKSSKQTEDMRELLRLPLHVIDNVISNLSLTDLLALSRCSKRTQEIVDRYFYVQKSLMTNVKKMHRLFPHLDPSQEQFRSIFHIKHELAKLFRVLPKNRLVEVDFSGIQRFHHGFMMEIMNESGTHMHSLFSNVTSLSFAGCLLSSYDLHLMSLCTQNLKSLTLTEHLLEDVLPEKDIDPSRIQNYLTLEKKGLIEHRRKIISHVKNLWPTLRNLIFVGFDENRLIG